MSDIAALVSDHLDIWTAATERKRGAGRGGGKRVSLYGIERLRALILDLAVRGRLLTQESDDGTGATLLDAIAAERKRQFASGEAKRLANPDPLSNAPFSIPESWAWTQLGIITNYGETEKADPGSVVDETWVLELEDVEKGTSRLIERVTHSTRKFQSQKNRFCVGDVIYGKLRPYLDKVLIADMPGICTTEMVPMRAYHGVEATYLRLFLKSPFFISLAGSSTHGMNLPRLGTDKARAAPFALPPLAEQRRIVAKVNELMALCDALEGESAAGLAAHQTLVETLLATLVNSADAADLAANWTRLEAYFDTLFATEASVDALKQSVLELAVRGRLVQRDETEGPASDVITNWRTAKQNKLENGGDRRVKPAGNPNKPHFPLPMHWGIQSFENIFLFIDYRGNTPPKTEGGIPLITAKNIRMGHLDREPREFVSPETYRSWMTRGFPKIGDLFFTTEAPLGNVCLNDIEEPFAIAQRAICLQPYGEANTRFFAIAIMSQSMQRVIDNAATGMTARGIKAAKLKTIPLPIPPAAEQERIVARVDELMALCDELKSRIAISGQIQMRLADAIVERAAA